jgi:hypothetical protein
MHAFLTSSLKFIIMHLCSFSGIDECETQNFKLSTVMRMFLAPISLLLRVGKPSFPPMQMKRNRMKEVTCTGDRFIKFKVYSVSKKELQCINRNFLCSWHACAYNIEYFQHLL